MTTAAMPATLARSFRVNPVREVVPRLGAIAICSHLPRSLPSAVLYAYCDAFAITVRGPHRVPGNHPGTIEM